jgi:8-oxo-dGTP diphosphatase
MRSRFHVDSVEDSLSYYFALKKAGVPVSPAPQVGVGILVVENGRVLLGKRKGSHGAGTWSAPGGHLEFGESIEACARREVLEETNLALKNLRLGPFTSNVFESEKKHYVTVFVIAAPASATLKTMEPDKCEGWVWFEWSDLPEPLFAPLATLRSQGFVLENVD